MSIHLVPFAVAMTAVAAWHATHRPAATTVAGDTPAAA
jgi:hypothetical protein